LKYWNLEVENKDVVDKVVKGMNPHLNPHNEEQGCDGG
jgi:hypothetical protein